MRILYDHQVFSLQNAGGASRYHYELASQLSKMPSFAIDVYLGLNGSVFPFESLNAAGSRVLSWKTKMQPGLPRYVLNELVISAYAALGGCWDVYHPTLYRKMSFVRSRRLVVTHHDCTHERFPEMFSDGHRVISAKRRLYRSADAIICVSESSRTDLLQYYNVNRSKTRVVHHGVTQLVRDSELARSFLDRIRRSYVLYVGTRHSYKNFSLLVEAYCATGVAQEFDLVLIGGGPLNQEERNHIQRLGIGTQVVHFPSPNDAILAEAYARAQLFVYPSLYEGFGIPPLEAMSLGCPVLAARSSSIPEVCRDAAIYFEPAEPDSLEKVLPDALNACDLNKRITRGRELATTYTWQACAEKTLEVYKNL
jgi:glycosyltransferase involved in cell wall biosynthesis